MGSFGSVSFSEQTRDNVYTMGVQQAANVSIHVSAGGDAKVTQTDGLGKRRIAVPIVGASSSTRNSLYALLGTQATLTIAAGTFTQMTMVDWSEQKVISSGLFAIQATFEG